MSIHNPYQSYKDNSFSTASPGELTLMLYDGCIKFIKRAKQAIEDKNISERNINIQKSQSIVRELMVTLRMEYEVSKNMMIMYDYMLTRLIEANMKNDISILDEIEGYVTEFRDTWKQVIQVNRQRQYAQSNGA